MEQFRMKSLFNGRITLYQCFSNFGISLTIGGENNLVDNDLLIHIQVLFWMVEIYVFKER